MTDGNGNLFMTTVTYAWNNGMTTYEVDSALRNMFGVSRIHAIDYARDQNGYPADGTGHIDMFVKLLDPTTIIVSETNDPVFKQATDDAADYFSSLRCGRRRCYRVVRVPGWSTQASFGYIWYSYTNSLIVGNSILVPGYSSGNDDEVKAIYERVAPGKNVTMINSDGIIQYGGSIHCLTMQIPMDLYSDVPFHSPSHSPSLYTSDAPSLVPSIAPISPEPSDLPSIATSSYE
jgi:agmatine deiminase